MRALLHAAIFLVVLTGCRTTGSAANDSAVKDHNDAGYCEAGLVRVPIGESVMDGEECNSCVCGERGFSCTRMACMDPPPITGCRTGDVVVPLNSSWPSSDGCNTCSCTERGLACTERACANDDDFGNDNGRNDEAFCQAGPVRIPVGESVRDWGDCNNCTCNEWNGRTGFACTELACGNRPVRGCRAGNVLLPLNSSWPSSDGCNTCSCTERGIACTEMACADQGNNDEPEEAGFCRAGLILVPVGERVTSGDNCNSCVCDEWQGEAGFACTEMACINPPPARGCRAGEVIVPYGSRWQSADGCNTCSCSERGFACTERACAD